MSFFGHTCHIRILQYGGSDFRPMGSDFSLRGSGIRPQGSETRPNGPEIRPSGSEIRKDRNPHTVYCFQCFYPLSKRMKFSEIYFLRKTFRFSSFLRMLLYFHLLSMSRDRNIVVDSIFISALSNIKYVH